MSEEETTLVVLAGGQGTRMGGPKGLLRIDDRPILEVLLDRLQWRGPTLLVTAPGIEHPPGYENFKSEISDSISGQGPLRGIVTALESGIERAIVLPVDMPAMTGDALRWLALLPVERGVFLRRNGEIESLPVLLTRDALGIARERLNSGRRSVHGLASEPGFAVVATPADWSAEIWLNVNEPADLLLAMRNR